MTCLRPFALMIPALIPSWRFFRTVEHSPRIEIRKAGEQGWQELTTRPDRLTAGRMLRRMVWNPRWNEALYLVSLSERIVENGSLRAMRELEARVSRQFPDQRLELRLVFIERQGGQLTRETLYQSAPFGAEG